MSEKRNCLRCANPVTDHHVRAGHAREVAAGVVCPLCLARETRAARTAQSAIHIDLRRAGWVLAGLTTASLAFYFLRSASFFDVGVGMFFLVLTVGVALLKVLQANVL